MCVWVLKKMVFYMYRVWVIKKGGVGSVKYANGNVLKISLLFWKIDNIRVLKFSNVIRLFIGYDISEF